MKQYRQRLAGRGIARFEVLGRESDRDLIPSLAKELAVNVPAAYRIREAVRNVLSGGEPATGGSSARCAVRRWSARNWM